MTQKTTIQVGNQHEDTRRLAKEFAADQHITLSQLVWQAVDDYLTTHQHIVPDTSPKLSVIREAALKVREYRCSFGDTVKCGRNAYWVFWDTARPYLDTYEYSCAIHLSLLLDPDIASNTVQRIEY